MQESTFIRCANTTKPCTGLCACTGYESKGSCPPLIVLAVLACATPMAVLPCIIGAAR